MKSVTKAGFVAVLGRPNSGKSTMLNMLSGQDIALVSHKANATRKRMNFIIPHTTKSGEKTQIIFIDTPGIHKEEKLLNKFMLQEALKAMGECDINLFLSPITDDLRHYEEFLDLTPDIPHIVLLTKIDQSTQEKIFVKIQEYKKYENRFLAIIPISCKKQSSIPFLLEAISKHLPQSPALYDEDILTTSPLKEIYKEIIRECIFEYLSDEIPYQSDVVVEKFIEEPNINKVYAKIIVEKESQKGMIIGKDAHNIKKIGTKAREKLEKMEGKKIFLKLNVFAQKGWSTQKEKLQKIGYNLDF